MQSRHPQNVYRAYRCGCGSWHVGRDRRRKEMETPPNMSGLFYANRRPLVCPICFKVLALAENLLHCSACGGWWERWWLASSPRVGPRVEVPRL